MSVLQRRRKLSSMEYVTNAYDIEKMSVDFVRRLTPKNARIYQTAVIRLVTLQSDLAYIGNEIFPTNKAEYQIRRILHASSKAILHALDVRLAGVYDALMENPQEAFNRKNGKPVDKAEAVAILDSLAEKLGCAIDNEDRLLKGIMDSDKERSKALPKADSALSETLSNAFEEAMKSLINLFV